MKEYHKINTIFKRDMDNKGKIIIGNYAQPEFEYLRNNKWIFTEKVDGTNIRIQWEKEIGIKIGGRTTNSQMPIFLLDKLNEIFHCKKFQKITKADSLCLYGEGFGAKIQKGGGNYIKDGVSFVLFDVLVDDWWLKREDVEEIAQLLDIQCVPVIGEGTLENACDLVKHKFNSSWGGFIAEGIVLRPAVELKTRAGHRIIAKIKCKDFN